MAEQCFMKEGSHPPVCGLHNVELVLAETPIDQLAPHLGRITVFMCPVSGLVVVDAQGRKPPSSA
jgi:hypothetical protein